MTRVELPAEPMDQAIDHAAVRLYDRRRATTSALHWQQKRRPGVCPAFSFAECSREANSTTSVERIVAVEQLIDAEENQHISGTIIRDCRPGRVEEIGQLGLPRDYLTRAERQLA
jgi:hypothetical protein